MKYVDIMDVKKATQSGVLKVKVNDTGDILLADVKSGEAAKIGELPVGQWKPFIEDVEIYNTGGFTERKQTGWICGRCKSKESITPYYKTRYCPHCGARMKGETDAK